MTLARVELGGLIASDRQQLASEGTPTGGTPTGGAPTGGSAPVTPAKVRFGIRPDYADKGAGVLVVSVTPKSPAETAGLRAGDRLLEWGGKSIRGAAGLAECLAAARPGDEVEVQLTRDGKAVKILVSLVARDGGR